MERDNTITNRCERTYSSWSKILFRKRLQAVLLGDYQRFTKTGYKQEIVSNPQKSRLNTMNDLYIDLTEKPSNIFTKQVLVEKIPFKNFGCYYNNKIQARRFVNLDEFKYFEHYIGIYMTFTCPYTEFYLIFDENHNPTDIFHLNTFI
jgi:hypothetical protein